MAQFPRIKIWVKEKLYYADLNLEFDNIRNNMKPSGIDGSSGNISEMRAQTDPYPLGVASLPTSLQGELERIRYVIKQLAGTTYWYEAGFLGAASSSLWLNGAGAPTYASATTFNVTGDQSAVYYKGRVLRYKDTGTGANYAYTMVKSYAAGVVTVVDGGLDSGLNSVQVANFEALKFVFPISGHLPSVFTGNNGDNLAGRMRVAVPCEPIGVDYWVEMMASAQTPPGTAGDTTVRVRSGLDPTVQLTTDVLVANTLAYNAKEKLGENPVHTELTPDTYLQVDVTTAPTGNQADDLTVILYCVPKFAKNVG